MPHVIVKMLEGRTEEQRKACARAVAKAVIDTIEDISEEPMVVSIMEIPREDSDQKINNINLDEENAKCYILEGELC